MAKLLCCVVYDKIKKSHFAFSFCNCKEAYIRDNVEMMIQAHKNLNDLQPKIIGEYDPDTGIIEPCNEEFGFDCYKMPMSKAEALAPLGVDFAREALEFEEYKKNKLKERYSPDNQ